MRFNFSRVLIAVAIAAAFSSAALADTIRLKNGSVIRGQVVGFRDEQFTVLMEPTARGRRNRIQVYIEEVESIEFDAAGGATPADTGDSQPAPQPDNRTAASSSTPAATQPAAPPRMQGGNTTTPANTPPRTTTTTGAAPTPSSSSSQLFPIRVRVRADNSANGWTDSGLMVRKGQRLRISASGRVSLGQGRFSTPTGLPRVLDNEKLMREEPTGGLIAVIGDDNDEFIFVGSGREFYATRDGRLFLGVNEGRLEDNTGTYDALIEAEPVTTSGQVRP